jgi:hypothetical protein
MPGEASLGPLGYRGALSAPPLRGGVSHTAGSTLLPDGNPAGEQDRSEPAAPAHHGLIAFNRATHQSRPARFGVCPLIVTSPAPEPVERRDIEPPDYLVSLRKAPLACKSANAGFADVGSRSNARRVRPQGGPDCTRRAWRNPCLGPVIGLTCRECLDDVIILKERHRRSVLRDYVAYYTRRRR